MTLIALAACGGQSPKACTTDCAMVARDYQVTFATGAATCGTESLLANSGAGTGVLEQNGSALTLTVGSFILSGTLHSDNSALFGPAPDTAIGESGGAVNEPGQDYLAGFFTANSDGQFNFDGTLLFIEGDNGCEVDSRSTWR